MPLGSIVLAACIAVSIADGDTLTVLCEHQQIKIRLAEIDAPEKKQPFGQKSKESLVELCFLKNIDLRVQAKDRYGRTVARVFCNGIDANEEQIRRGMAWVYDRYAKNKNLYVLQEAVRASKLGIWADTNPVPPWKWRRGKR